MLCSTLDWALMETWKQAGIPLEAVLRGIDAALDRYDARPNKTRKVNSLAYCAQEVLASAEDIQEAGVGADHRAKPEAGLDHASIAAFFERNAANLELRLQADAGKNLQSLPKLACPIVRDVLRALRDLAAGLRETKTTPLEDLERRMTVMEEKVFAALLTGTPDDQLVAVRAEADRELSPYRRKMSAAQIDHLQKQYLHKRLLEHYGIPRLSLFYM
jgi:hypothetical protein